MATLAGLLTFGLLACALAPFDFVTTTDGLHQSLRRARIPLPAVLEPGRGLPVGLVGGDGFAEVTAQGLRSGGAFAVLGFLMALGGREGRTGRGTSILTAIGNGWVLVVVIETVQLFSTLHVFDVFDMLQNGLGVTIGACCCLAVAGHSEPGGNRETDRTIPGPMLLVIWLGQVGFVFASAAGSLELSVTGLWTARYELVPFADYFRLPFTCAVGSVTEVAAVYAMLTVTTAVVVERFGWVAGLWPVGVAVVVAVVAEMLTAMHPGGRVGTSDVILASVTAVVTVRLYALATAGCPTSASSAPAWRCS